MAYVIPTTHHISKILNREPQTHEMGSILISSFLFEVEKSLNLTVSVIIQIPYPIQG